MMVDPGKQLSAAEWTCLEAISKSERSSGGEPHLVEVGVSPCSHGVVQRLRSLGLVETVTVNWLPLEMQKRVIRLTTEGKRLLAVKRNG